MYFLLKDFDEIIENVKLLPDNMIVCWNYGKFCSWNSTTGEKIELDDKTIVNIKEGDIDNKEFASKTLDYYFGDDFNSFMNTIWVITDKIMILGLDLDDLTGNSLNSLWILDNENPGNPVIRNFYYGSMTTTEIIKIIKF